MASDAFYRISESPWPGVPGAICARLKLTIPVTLHDAPSFTATVPSSEGGTSEFSKPVTLAE